MAFVGLVARRPEQVIETVRCDRHLSRLALDHLPGDLAADARDRTLQAANAGLTRVAVDHRRDRRAGEFDVLVRQAVILELLFDQEIPRDHHLLLDRVAGEVDDLHPVEQRPRDRVIDVRGRDEEHPGEVERDLQIVIRKVPVLLRIQHLEHGRGRVAAEV